MKTQSPTNTTRTDRSAEPPTTQEEQTRAGAFSHRFGERMKQFGARLRQVPMPVAAWVCLGLILPSEYAWGLPLIILPPASFVLSLIAFRRSQYWFDLGPALILLAGSTVFSVIDLLRPSGIQASYWVELAPVFLVAVTATVITWPTRKQHR